jgi:uncharacterized protein VirK/YbjX
MRGVPNYFRLMGRLLGAAPCLIQDGGIGGAWQKFKFVGRGLAYGRWMAPWLEYLDSPAMKTVTQVHPRLYLKVQWPYINSSWDAARRLELLRQHFDFVLGQLSKEARARLLFTEFLELARWEIERMGRFSFRLSHGNKFVQEGEMVLSLHHENTNRSCALAHFSISRDAENRPEIVIGCFQGGKPAEDPDEISTRDMVIGFKKHLYGLRPKNMVLFALRHVAAAWSIGKIRAVSTEKQLWAKNVQFDYNTFWIESGGKPGAEGMYDLPVEVSFEELHDKPKKRSMYRRRYLFLEMLGREIGKSLADPDRAVERMDLSALEAVEVAGPPDDKDA